jgi:hypothetical protein
MEIHVKNTYDLFFHPFGNKGFTKEGLGRLAASFAIFIGTLGIYHLIIGSIQKYRVSHPHPENAASAKATEAFANVHAPKAPTLAQQFFEAHPEVMSPEQWKQLAQAAGKNLECVTNDEAFAELAKKKDLETYMESPCKIFGENQKVKDTRILMYIPAGLDFDTMRAIARTKFPDSPKDGFTWLDAQVVQSLEGEQTRGGWVLLTKSAIPESKYHHNIDQWKMVKSLCDEKTGENYEVPTPLEFVACLLGRYNTTGEHLFAEESTRCEGKTIGIGVDAQPHQVTVGFFSPRGLDMRMSLIRKHMQQCGIAALQRLS